MSYQVQIKALVEQTGGQLLQGDPEKLITGINNDSRSLQENDLFVALLAERDGHDFVPSAVKTGAGALLVSKAVQVDASIPVIQVPDTLVAMGDLAAAWCRSHKLKVVGITGSNGKTSTKEILAQIMLQVAPTLYTAGNFNNLIGLPLTLFRLEKEQKYAILEMGMNAFGEIEQLAKIAEPDVAVITSISGAHLEGLGSIEGVAKAKGELFASLSPNAIAVVHADDSLIFEQAKNLSCQKLFITEKRQLPKDLIGKQVIQLLKSESLGVKGFELRVSRPSGEEFELLLPLVGRHQVSNALAAIACACALGVSSEQIVKGLALVRPAGRRLRLSETKGALHLIDDCYNSNPASCKAALETLKELRQEAPGIAVLGDMLEMGAHEEQSHQEVGVWAAKSGLKALFSFGPRSLAMAEAARSAGMTVEQTPHFSDIEELWIALEKELEKNLWLLVKGSRGMKLERISEKISSWDGF